MLKSNAHEHCHFNKTSTYKSMTLNRAKNVIFRPSDIRISIGQFEICSSCCYLVSFEKNTSSYSSRRECFYGTIAHNTLQYVTLVVLEKERFYWFVCVAQKLQLGAAQPFNVIASLTFCQCKRYDVPKNLFYKKEFNNAMPILFKQHDRRDIHVRLQANGFVGPADKH